MKNSNSSGAQQMVPWLTQTADVACIQFNQACHTNSNFLDNDAYDPMTRDSNDDPSPSPFISDDNCPPSTADNHHNDNMQTTTLPLTQQWVMSTWAQHLHLVLKGPVHKTKKKRRPNWTGPWSGLFSVVVAQTCGYSGCWLPQFKYLLK